MRLDHAARAARTVGHRGRDRELSTAADPHSLDAGVPPGDHLALAELERERLRPVPRGVELLPGRERDAGVVNGDLACRALPRRRRRRRCPRSRGRRGCLPRACRSAGRSGDTSDLRVMSGRSASDSFEPGAGFAAMLRTPSREHAQPGQLDSSPFRRRPAWPLTAQQSQPRRCRSSRRRQRCATLVVREQRQVGVEVQPRVLRVLDVVDAPGDEPVERHREREERVGHAASPQSSRR